MQFFLTLFSFFNDSFPQTFIMVNIWQIFPYHMLILPFLSFLYIISNCSSAAYAFGDRDLIHNACIIPLEKMIRIHTLIYIQNRRVWFWACQTYLFCHFILWTVPTFCILKLKKKRKALLFRLCTGIINTMYIEDV